MEEVLKHIAARLDRIESTMATKEELARLESKLATKEDIAGFRSGMDKRLDDIYDALQQVLGDAGEIAEGVEKRVRTDLEPRIKRLEQIHPQGAHSNQP